MHVHVYIFQYDFNSWFNLNLIWTFLYIISSVYNVQKADFLHLFFTCVQDQIKMVCGWVFRNNTYQMSRNQQTSQEFGLPFYVLNIPYLNKLVWLLTCVPSGPTWSLKQSAMSIVARSQNHDSFTFIQVKSVVLTPKTKLYISKINSSFNR